MKNHCATAILAMIAGVASFLCNAKDAFAVGTCNTTCQLTTYKMGTAAAGSLIWIQTNLGLTTPACGNTQWMAFSSVGDRGKDLLALVQSAILSGRLVTLIGDGTCNGASNVETLSEIIVGY